MFSNKRSSSLTALIGLLSLTSCTTPKHTDLLVFGTNTQFGVAVSADSTSNPGVNIGYKRQEVVLMPLYVNGKESKFAPTTPTADTQGAGNKYLGTDGASAEKADTYSVLASFGASGSGKTSGSAEVGIAQYFATGLAARTLAYAGGALINTGDKAAESAGDTAKAAAAASTGVNIGSTSDTRLANLSLLNVIDGSLKNLKSDPEAQAHVAKLDQIDRSADAPTFTEYHLSAPPNTNIVSVRTYHALSKGHDFSTLIQYHSRLNQSVALLKSHLEPPNANLQVKDAAGTAAATIVFVAQASADFEKQKAILDTLDKKLRQDTALIAAVQYFTRQLVTSTPAPSK